MAAPLPNPTEDSAPFWQGCHEGHLSAQRCPACARFRWPPAEFCPHCHHHGGDWVALPGGGVITAFVVVRRAFDPGFEDRIPYVVAQIALDGAEGVVITGNVVADPIESIHVGQQVAVAFRDAGAIDMPEFHPA